MLGALRGSTARHAAFAVEVEGLGRFSSAGASLRRPASTQKLYTALAALLQLGPDYRMTTEVRATGGVLEDGTLEGDLALVGSGDPLLSTRDLDALAAEVAAAGISRVDGTLYGNDSRYDARRTAPGWRSRYLLDEVGPITALAVDGNMWWRNRTYLRAPPLWNARRFAGRLRAAGVDLDGTVRLGEPPADLTHDVVAAHHSPPLSHIVRYMLRWSDNFVAEMLLKEMGTTIDDPTTRGGIRVVWLWAHRFGMSPGRTYDGSGLSLYDRKRPWHEVEWLRQAEKTDVGAVFREALPVACHPRGTLRERMCHTPAAGRVSAKTGTLAGAVTLSGYTQTARGRRVRFAFMLEGVGSRDAARKAIDRALVAIVTDRG